MGRDLGVAGIPFGARKPLLLLLSTAGTRTTLEQGLPMKWNSKIQRAVLEQVLRENTALAQRLQRHTQQQAEQCAVPAEYVCPCITCEVMQDPVIARDGQTYEREAIATWLAGHGTSPMTRARIPNDLLSVRPLKEGIDRWQQQVASELD